MGRVDRRVVRSASTEAGFSLVETLIAMAILAGALLSLAGVFAMGLRHLAGSTPNLLAREKAREAVESVHTARDTGLITWGEINNVANGGVFRNPELPGVVPMPATQPLRKAGPDGLVNTADDDAALEAIISPGLDGQIGNADDISTPMATFARQIEITPLLDAGGAVMPTLRQLRVTITYLVGRDRRQYVLTTYISSIS
jgi:prepilin-type N-terminal cleavage/methylation domain-containing protein